MVLLSAAGENLYLMQYALICSDLQLILASMGEAGRQAMLSWTRPSGGAKNRLVAVLNPTFSSKRRVRAGKEH
jgi:hypothetical protein